MKSNYFIDTSLLKSLSIGIKEAIVLDFFYYYNNRNCKSYQISITKIAEHLNIARGHLYKILGKLVKRELIVKSCREYIVTQNYVSVRKKVLKKHIATLKLQVILYQIMLINIAKQSKK